MNYEYLENIFNIHRWGLKCLLAIYISHFHLYYCVNHSETFIFLDKYLLVLDTTLKSSLFIDNYNLSSNYEYLARLIIDHIY